MLIFFPASLKKLVYLYHACLNIYAHGIQDPMRGCGDQMFEDLVANIHAGDMEALAKDAVAPPRRRLVPEFMLQLARRVSPF